MRRSSIRRDDPVTPEVHALVLARDRGCVAFKLDSEHACFDQWGYPHGPHDLARLTLDHVKSHAMLGKRAPSDSAHLVAMCWSANVLGWASAHRADERAYLRDVVEPHSAHVDPVQGCEPCYQASR